MFQFSLSRMQAVFRIFWRDQPWFAYGVAVLLAMVFGGMMINNARDVYDIINSSVSQDYFFGTCLHIVCTIYAAFIFREYGQSGGAQSILYLPATSAEKSTVKGMLMLVIFPLITALITTLVFYIAKELSLSLFAFRFKLFDSGDLLRLFKNIYISIFIGCAVGLKWPKSGIFVLMGVYLIAWLLTSFSFGGFSDGTDATREITLWQASSKRYVEQSLPEHIKTFVMLWNGGQWLVGLGFALYVWQHIKEKEI